MFHVDLKYQTELHIPHPSTLNWQHRLKLTAMLKAPHNHSLYIIIIFLPHKWPTNSLFKWTVHYKKKHLFIHPLIAPNLDAILSFVEEKYFEECFNLFWSTIKFNLQNNIGAR